MGKQVKRIDGAYDAEKYYVTTPVTGVEGKVRVNAHKLIDYARARMDVALLLATDFRQQPQTGVIGFLTGSIGLLATARDLLERLHPTRFKLVMGLAHAQGGDIAEAELHAVLNDLHGKGVRRFVLVDEVKSGSQMTAGIKAATRWVRSTGTKDAEITAIGVSGPPPKDKERPPTVAELVIKAGLAEQIINPRTIITMSLLEMDTAGLKFRGVEKRNEYIGEYDFYREQPDRGLFIVCPDGGQSGGAGLRSLDAAFAGTINRILGLSHPTADTVPMNITCDPDGEEIPHAVTWPDTIENGSCRICRDLLRTAREMATIRHHWTSVAAYHLSNDDKHPPNRDLHYWFAAEKHIIAEGKRDGAPPWLRKLT